MNTLVIPLVGSYYRPPAPTILAHLPLGFPLILEPEPDNPYDDSAVKVLADLGLLTIDRIPALREALADSGHDINDLWREPVHLGYLAASGHKTAGNGPGNREAINAIFNAYQLQREASLDEPPPENPFTTWLDAEPTGNPTVVLTIFDMEAKPQP